MGERTTTDGAQHRQSRRSQEAARHRCSAQTLHGAWDRPRPPPSASYHTPHEHPHTPDISAHHHQAVVREEGSKAQAATRKAFADIFGTNFGAALFTQVCAMLSLQPSQRPSPAAVLETLQKVADDGEEQKSAEG